MGAWLWKLRQTFLDTGYYRLMLEGLGNTVVITLGALLIGVAIGTLIAVTNSSARITRPANLWPGCAMPMSRLSGASPWWCCC